MWCNYGVSVVDTKVQNADCTIQRRMGKRSSGMVMEGMVEADFHFFSKLPIDLRLIVWKHALPGPRVVEIEWNPNTKQWFCPYESQSERSSLSRTNKESREVYHKSYLPLAKVSRVVTQPIVSDATDPFHVTSQHITSFFHSTVDILYIGPCSRTDFCVTSESFKVLAAGTWMQKVRLLATEYQEWDDFVESSDSGVEMHLKILSLLPNLTEIILVLGDIYYGSLLSDAERWASRPHAEIEFIDAENPNVTPWLNEVASLYNRKFFTNDGLKFSIKEILRGGVIPEIIGHFR